MTRADISFYLSIFAVIGTAINVIVNVVKFKQDGAKIKIVPVIDYTTESPIKEKLEFIVSSHGKKQVYIDYIEYVLRVENSKEIIKQDVSSEPLSEGQNIVIDMELRSDIDLCSIYRVNIVDKTGRKWKVKWLSSSSLKDYRKKEELYLNEKENEKYKILVKGYKVWKFYYISILKYKKPIINTKGYENYTPFSIQVSFYNPVTNEYENYHNNRYLDNALYEQEIERIEKEIELFLRNENE